MSRVLEIHNCPSVLGSYTNQIHPLRLAATALLKAGTSSSAHAEVNMSLRSLYSCEKKKLHLLFLKTKT